MHQCMNQPNRNDILMSIFAQRHASNAQNKLNVNDTLMNFRHTFKSNVQHTFRTTKSFKKLVQHTTRVKFTTIAANKKTNHYKQEAIKLNNNTTPNII